MSVKEKERPLLCPTSSSKGDEVDLNCYAYISVGSDKV